MTTSPHSMTLCISPEAAGALRSAFLLVNPTTPSADELYIEDLLDNIHEERERTKSPHDGVLESELSITTDVETWHRALASAQALLESDGEQREADSLRSAYVQLHTVTDGKVYAARVLLAYERHAPDFVPVARWLNERTEAGENMEQAVRDFAPPAARSAEYHAYAPYNARHAAERLEKLAKNAQSPGMKRIAESVFLIGFDQISALFNIRADNKTEYRAGTWEEFARAASLAIAEYISPHNQSAAEYIEMMSGSTRRIVAS